MTCPRWRSRCEAERGRAACGPEEGETSDTEGASLASKAGASPRGQVGACSSVGAGKVTAERGR